MAINAAWTFNGPQSQASFWGMVVYVDVGAENDRIFTFDFSGTELGFVNQGETIFTALLGLTVPPPPQP